MTTPTADTNPNTVHGQLLEAVHVSGYTANRAAAVLDWLLDDGRWKQVGDGFSDVNVFLASIDLTQFRLAADRRQKLAKKLKALEATNVATAKAIGVSEKTVRRDTEESANAESGVSEVAVQAESQDAESANAESLPVAAGSMDVHYSSESVEWATPQDLFDQLDAEFGFRLDVCATPENAKCVRFFSLAEDGLSEAWEGNCWMNPPYGDAIPAWVAKAHKSADDGATVVCLVPARVETAWWWDHCRYAEIRFLRGRLKFGGGDNSAPFPSAVVIFGRPASVVWWER